MFSGQPRRLRRTPKRGQRERMYSRKGHRSDLLLARQERPSMIHWEWVALNVFRAASSLASNAKAGTAGENVFPKVPSFHIQISSMFESLAKLVAMTSGPNAA